MPKKSGGKPSTSHVPTDTRTPKQVMKDVERLGNLGLLSEETRERVRGSVRG